ncbi:hypothetical protein [Archangium lipolyticum]|uniref:hypothetical protein n=1 Tax=Archangium lipolyticum TaxID=2970465 RepID=UPI00214A1E42|nr:hypothetical protein [Archangium lipolyticum]
MNTRRVLNVAGTGLLGCALLLAGAPSTAEAADYPYRRNWNANSRETGLQGAVLPVLERAPGRGARVVADELVARFRTSTSGITTAGNYSIILQRNGIRYVGDSGWQLTVYGDGTAVRYHNPVALDAGRAVPLASRLSNTDLEALGRRFVTEQLGRHVLLGTGETLEALKTEHQVEARQADSTTAPLIQEVSASTVIFSRTINGVGVVGSGSKVAVIFGNDRLPAGFEFDWTAYQPTGRRQQTMDVNSIHRRASSVLPVDPNDPSTTLERLECGYFDNGTRRRDTLAPVQPACFYHYTKQVVGDPILNRANPADGLFKSAYGEAVPAGTTVEPDQRWPQAMLLCTGHSLCGTTGTTTPGPVSGPGPQ